MYVVETDTTQRFVVISVAGHVTAGEAKEAVARVRQIMENVAEGFVALADFRWLDSMPATAAPYIAEIMDAFTEKKVSAIVRVIPDPHKDIGINILSYFHYGPEVRQTTVTTLADAVQALAGE